MASPLGLDSSYEWVRRPEEWHDSYGFVYFPQLRSCPNGGLYEEFVPTEEDFRAVLGFEPKPKKPRVVMQEVKGPNDPLPKFLQTARRTPPPIPFFSKPRMTYNRRRTDNNFPRPEPLYSAPTIASSGLTASASANDLSQPDHLVPRFQQQSNFRAPLRETMAQTPGYEQSRVWTDRYIVTTPTRIPTPTYHTELQQGRRYVSTPVLPSERKEVRLNLMICAWEDSNCYQNIKPQQPKTLRLLGPISPTRNKPAPLRTNQAQMPKSRTMNMISSLTASISRSSLSSSKSRPNLNASYNRTPSYTSYTKSTTNLTPIPSTLRSTSPPPLPPFTTNIRQIHTAQPSSYWCGRFQALNDRFQHEIFEASLIDPIRYKQYITITEYDTPKKSSVNMKDSCDQATTFTRHMEDEDMKREKRVFIHLEALCATKAARHSLSEFQQLYARKMGNEGLLPVGGRMYDREPWLTKIGKAMDSIKRGGSGSVAGEQKENVRAKTKTPRAGRGRGS